MLAQGNQRAAEQTNVLLLHGLYLAHVHQERAVAAEKVVLFQRCFHIAHRGMALRLALPRMEDDMPAARLGVYDVARRNAQRLPLAADADEHLLAPVNLPDGLARHPRNRLVCQRLEQEPERCNLIPFQRILDIIRHENNRHFLVLLAHAPRHVDAVHRGHLNIADKHVESGIVRLEEFPSGFKRADLQFQPFPPGESRQMGVQRLAYPAIVIQNCNSNHFRRSLPQKFFLLYHKPSRSQKIDS